MNKRILLISLILIFVVTFSACGNAEKVIDADTNTTVLTIGNKDISLGKALVFVLGQKNYIDNQYEPGIWNVKVGDNTFGEHLQHKIKSRIALAFAGAEMSKKNGIELNSDEQTLVQSASNYFSSNLTSSEKSMLNLSDEDIQDIFSSYRLAIKGYNDIINSVNIEVSQDEARVIKLLQIKISKADLDETAISEKQSKAREAYNKLLEGTDFYTVALTYNEADDIDLTVCRTDLSDDEEKVAFGLNSDEYSDIFETEDSIIIYKCVNSFDETLSDSKREELLRLKKSDKYLESLNAYLNDHPVVWNEEAWNLIDISSISYETKVGFYDVYEMFFPNN